MTETTTVADKALTNQGVAAADLDPAQQGHGNPEPAAPSNEPPAKEGAEAKDPAPAPADAAETETPDENAELDTDAWGSTGDEVGDSVLTLLQNSGLDPEGAKALMYDAVQSGDVTKIDRDALIEKVGKAKASLILAGTENFIRRRTEHANAVIATVHEITGGEAQWGAIRDWANANVPPADLNDYKALVEAGGVKAKFAVKELARLYNADAGNTTIGTPEVQPDAAAPGTAPALTRAQYVEQLAAAHKRGASDAEITEINRARTRGRNRGI